ncbi:MAG: DUF6174 domain-containing protein [Pirellulales bacterium]
MISISDGQAEPDPETSTPPASDQPVATRSAGSRSSLSRRAALFALILGVSFLATATVLVFVLRDRTPRLTDARLQEALLRWEQHGPDSYRMQLHKLGNRTDAVTIEVRDRQPVAFVLNGSADFPRRVWSYWTVQGMFETLEHELAGSADPRGAFGASEGANVTLRAQFDTQYGYPRYYLRSVDPDPLNSGWRVESFEPL